MCYHREDNKLIVDEVYENFVLKERRGRKVGVIIKEYPQLNIEEDKHCNNGIYMIKLDNKIYIGSTMREFKRRFREHLYGMNGFAHTKELLDNGGIFSILHDMTGIEDEELLRMVEQEYIMFYDLETDYEVINRKPAITEPKEKVKYKTLKVEEKDYDKVIELLAREGIGIQ